MKATLQLLALAASLTLTSAQWSTVQSVSTWVDPKTGPWMTSTMNNIMFSGVMTEQAATETYHAKDSAGHPSDQITTFAATTHTYNNEIMGHVNLDADKSSSPPPKAHPSSKHHKREM